MSTTIGEGNSNNLANNTSPIPQTSAVKRRHIQELNLFFNKKKKKKKKKKKEKRLKK